MAASFRIDQHGMHELLDTWNGPVGLYLAQKTVRVEATAKRLCPVDTGRLRASITHELATDSRGIYGVVGTNVDYAPHVEFGTSRMRAQPFLRPALEAAR